MPDTPDAEYLFRHLTAMWDDADVLDALDELDAELRPLTEPRTPKERAAERAAREDWNRAGA